MANSGRGPISPHRADTGPKVERPPVALPDGIEVFERGWLSSNNILLHAPGQRVLIDSGYAAHAAQTVNLVERALKGAPLDLLLNTHLHSDHCGGNRLLQTRYPGLQTRVPPGSLDAVQRWDQERLSFRATGQLCDRFVADAALRPGDEVCIGMWRWQVHAAPGHDPLAIVLFEPSLGVLISADALWENGFGVVFPELEGEAAFDDVARTLDLIESLRPRIVIPGHGAVFADLEGALTRARSRLSAFIDQPTRHALHAAKVLLKFKLLEVQQITTADFLDWASATPYFGLVHARHASNGAKEQWLQQLIDQLVSMNQAHVRGGWIFNEVSD